MTGYHLAFHREALAALQRLDSRTFRQVALRVLRLAEDPRPHDSEQIKGFRDPEGGRPLYRVDQGDYRILYAVDYQTRVVFIFDLGHRKDIYRRLS